MTSERETWPTLAVVAGLGLDLQVKSYQIKMKITLILYSLVAALLCSCSSTSSGPLNLTPAQKSALETAATTAVISGIEAIVNPPPVATPAPAAAVPAAH